MHISVWKKQSGDFFRSITKMNNIIFDLVDKTIIFDYRREETVHVSVTWIAWGPSLSWNDINENDCTSWSFSSFDASFCLLYIYLFIIFSYLLFLFFFHILLLDNCCCYAIQSFTLTTEIPVYTVYSDTNI